MRHRLPIILGSIFLVVSLLVSVLGLVNTGIPEFYYPVSTSGLDLIAVTLFSSSLLAFFILNVVAYTFLGVFVGIVANRSYSGKTKLFTCVIALIIFCPLSIYSHSLKNADAKIFAQSYSGEWFNHDASTCESISVFNSRRRSDCYTSLSKTSAITADICSKIEYISIDRDDCYRRLEKSAGI